MALHPQSVLRRARACIRIESDALTATARGLGAEFVATARAVEATVAAGGKLIFSGVGKSAHIAQKLTGTFNSTGVSSCFLDATQALHGDLGLCAEGDLAIILSNSGQTEEILRLLPMLKRFGVGTVAFTAHADSDLAKNSDHRLIYRVPREACPLELAPTASTTAALALGDALAMVLLEARGLTRDDFARYHPAGNLGRVLLLRVRDIMRTGERLPVLPDTATTQDAILAMTKAKSGSIALVHPKKGRLTGILTDGDFRRSALTGPDFLLQPVSQFMTRSPKIIRDDALGVDALRLFEAHRIDDLIVVNAAGAPVGLIDGQDLPKLKNRLMNPIRIGIIGMGGFAGWHHNVVKRLEDRGLARLICTCDPQAAAFAAEQQNWQFAHRGVGVFPDYKSMLAACHRDLDLLVVPTPINLHAEMHQAGVELGIPVYLEKPPTLDYLELEEMIVRDRQARHASLVGFNFIIEKPRLALKQRLIAGEFGAVRSTSLLSLWPRPADYFRRNNWAGRLMMDGRVVLDSCMGNALAHFVHNMLFWVGGPELLSWAQIAQVRAELYRAHAIEGADTFFVEAVTTGGANMRFALSHACSGQSLHSETVNCERAEIKYVVGQQAEVRWHDGRIERFPLGPFDGLHDNHLEYHRYLRGELPRPATTLVDSRPFVILNDLAHVSSGQITPFPAELLSGIRDEKEQKDYFSVAGMPRAVDAFLSNGTWPGPNGWNRATGPAVTPADLPRFHDTIRTMLAAR